MTHRLPKGIIEGAKVKTLRKLYLKLRGYTFPEDYGAKGDGVTDDTLAIQSALDATRRGVWFSAGKTYRIAQILRRGKPERE